MNSAELTISETAPQATSSWRDNLGIVASIGCAIHCAAMPFVIAYLPMLGLSFLADDAFHKWMALVCFLIAIAAFLPGLRTHGSWLPVGIGSAGLVVITFAAFGLAGECCPTCEAVATDFDVETSLAASECHDYEHYSLHAIEVEQREPPLWEVKDQTKTDDKGWFSHLAPWITPFGGMLLVSAHLLNRRYGCLCGCCGPDDAQVI